MRDGGGTVQAVALRPDVPEPAWQACEDATQESSTVVTALARENKRAMGGYELSMQDVQPVSIAVDYPIPPNKHGVGSPRCGVGSPKENGHLWPR